MGSIGVIVDNEFTTDIRVRREVEILRNHGYDIKVLCFGFDRNEYPPMNGIDVRRIRIKRKIKNILYFAFNRIPLYELLWKKQIKRFIDDFDLAGLHVHDLYMAKAAGDAIDASGKTIPLILDLHENYPYAIQTYNWTRGFLRNLIANPKAWIHKEAEYLRRASGLLVLSEAFKSDLRRKHPFLTDVEVTSFPNIIDFRKFESFRVDTNLEKPEGTVLTYFGVVAERRGIFDTLEVFRKALSRGAHVKLLVIGPIDRSDKKRFMAAIHSEVLRDKVIYIPWIELKYLVSYMHISDILLSPLLKNPQHESGVANKVFQYMFAAKPLIVSDCRPQKELVESFECGLSYSTLDEFLECVLTLVGDEELRRILGENGRRNLYAEFDNENYGKILIDFYRKMGLQP